MSPELSWTGFGESSYVEPAPTVTDDLKVASECV